jgi:hypothetical protein
MIWILVIVTMNEGKPIAEPMQFETGGECYATASWVRRVDNSAKTVCFEVRKGE